MIQTRPDIPNRLWQLCEAVCLESQSENDAQELEELLKGHADRQQAFLDYCRLHTQLYFLVSAKHATERVRSELLRESPAGVTQRAPRLSLGHVLSSLRASVPGGDVLVGGLILAAVVVAFWGLLTFSLAVLRRGADHAIEIAAPGKDLPESPAALTDAPEGSTRFVATLTRLAGRWSDNTPPWISGDRLAKGELELVQGVAELTFDSGSRVILEAPGVFRIDDRNAGYLRRGKLVARVPGSAVGFKVVSPSAEYVDFGTEFALDVSGNGASQLHVLEGTVQLRPLGQPEQEAVLLRAWQAASVLSDGVMEHRFVSQPSRFRRSATPPSVSFEPLPVLSYQYTSSIVPNRAAHRSDPSLSKLTDGVRGSFDLNDNAWIGFEDPRGLNGDDGTPQPGIRFEVDSQSRSIDAVRISYLLLPFSAIHAPASVRVRAAESESSLDSAPWSTLVGFDRQDNPAGLSGVESAISKTVTFDLPKLKGDWLELEFNNSGQWTYLSEITLLHASDSGSNLREKETE